MPASVSSLWIRRQAQRGWRGCPALDISADAVTSFNTEVMTVPQFDPEHPQMISRTVHLLFNKSDSQEVLASWLFTQYLLTNDVQIAYSETEGYIPVTKKAQEAAAYQDYLSRCGEDTSTHYEVKIKAAKLLLSHIDDTFVTPVFNGSASLRDAAVSSLRQSPNPSVEKKRSMTISFSPCTATSPRSTIWIRSMHHPPAAKQISVRFRIQRLLCSAG